MGYEIVSGRGAFQFESCFFGLIVVLAPKHLEKTIGCNTNECGFGRVGMVWSHGGNAGGLECIIRPLGILHSGRVCRIELNTWLELRAQQAQDGDPYPRIRGELVEPISPDNCLQIINGISVPAPRNHRAVQVGVEV